MIQSDDYNGQCPTFSVIVPTYNRPAPLAACLGALSALNYRRDRFEVIVVDDGGDHDLGAALQQVAGAMQLRSIRQTNAGPGAARNAGADAATGEFLAFTDDDCIVHADWLRRLAEAISSNPDALVGGQSHNALPQNLYAAASHTVIDVVNSHFNRDHANCTFFASNNLAMRRANFLAVGGFDPSFRCSEDRDLCDRWSARGWRIVFAPDAVVKHRRDMGLWGFCRQHFGYGQGAWRFHRARERRGTGKLQVEGNFYMKCFREPFRTQPLRRAIPLAALLGVWQVTNAAGFFYEAARTSRRSGE